MSKVSDIYDLLLTQCSTIYPSHVKLINPYIPELNDDVQFEKAWGLVVSNGTNTNRFVDCKLSIERDFILTLTRKIFSGNIRSGTAVDEREDKEKLLLEDQFLFIQAIENNATINGDDSIGKIIFQNDAGLEFVKVGRVDLIMIRSVLSVEYFENLT